MKTLRFFLVVYLLLTVNTIQAQSEAQKRQAALSAKEAINDFQSSLGSLFGSAPKEQDNVQRRRNIGVVNDYVASNCRISVNDLLRGSNVLDWNEYFRRIPLEFPDGLLFEIELKKATFSKTFRTTSQGLLIDVYAQKSIYGTRRNGEQVELSNKPCRIGVYLNALGNSSGGCKIGFIDHDLSGQNNTFSLEDGTTPYDYKTLNETLSTIAEQVNAEIKQKGLKKIQLTTFTYEQQGVVDDFALKTTTAFRQELAKLNPSLEITSPSRSWQDEIKIKGGYQHKGNYVEFVAQLEDDTQKPLSKLAIDRLLPKNLDPNSTVIPVLAPPVIPEVKQVKQDLNKIKEPLPNIEALKFGITTNRGINSLIYEEQDTMLLAVKANKACYVRLVYRMANGKLALLRNRDFKINEYELNKWVDIRDIFECSSPFGAEFLIAYASTDVFESLKTHEEDGYIIIDNPLEEVKRLSTSRAFKNKGSVVEQQLQITTRTRRK
ncbi:hypothetical protein P1X15_29630 [Runella sp. MFBS21]|uniref:hypothetical protein n=1 Tax=Runella sp. MFBS21 TaxID=3034018 RepID=UPI0023F6B849|nr:hypothetical protein [Runella sp. MFBS21]MDF7821815.1 hypothetical protein [Runella sp. MFBS21]